MCCFPGSPIIYPSLLPVTDGWLVVPTQLKNISQLGWLFLIYGKIKNVPNHQPDRGLICPWTTMCGPKKRSETIFNESNRITGWIWSNPIQDVHGFPMDVPRISQAPSICRHTCLFPVILPSPWARCPRLPWILHTSQRGNSLLGSSSHLVSRL